MNTGTVTIRINRNENDWGCSPAVLEALATLEPADICRYPDETPLQQALADRLDVPVDRVRITAAGDEAIRMVIEGLTATGDTVMIPTPEFPIFRWCAETRRRQVAAVPLDENYLYDLPAIISAGRNAALVVLMSPHNPAGTTLSQDELGEILTVLGDTPVLLDEAYGEFTGMSFSNMTNDFANLLVLKTFSKAYGLAGLRLGALIGQPRLLEQASEAQMPYAVGTPAIRAGLAALKDPSFVRMVRDEVTRNRERLREALAGMDIPSLPSGGNFVSAWFGPDASRICRRLSDAGVLVRNVGNEHRMPGWLRFTIGNRDSCRAAIRALEQVTAEPQTEGVTP